MRRDDARSVIALELRMNISTKTIWVVCLASLVACSQGTHSSTSAALVTEPSVVLTGGTVIDPADGSVSQRDLCIVDGRLVDMSTPGCQGFSNAVDISGKWVLPGLHDMHVHNFGDNLPPDGEFDSPSHDVVTMEIMGNRMLYSGITTYLDLHAPVDDIIDLRDRTRAGDVLQPSLYAAGPIFMYPNGHPLFSFPGAVTIAAGPAAAPLIGLYDSHDLDVIKFVYDNGERPDGSFTDMPYDVMRGIVQAAHASGRKAIAHVGTWQGVRDIATEGVDAFTHIPSGPMPSDIPQLLIDSGTTVITTICAFMELGHIADPATQSEVLDDALLHQVTTAGHIAAYRDVASYDEDTAAWTQWSLAENATGTRLANVAQLFNAGVNIVAGTDGGNTGAFMGYSLHRELLLMERSGAERMAVLRSATTDAAEFLDVESGMQPGAPADLLVLSRNPLEDIQHTKDIFLVLKDGSIVDRTGLQLQAL